MGEMIMFHTGLVKGSVQSPIFSVMGVKIDRALSRNLLLEGSCGRPPMAECPVSACLCAPTRLP